MKRVVVLALLVGCGNDPAKIPDDHRIHRTDTADRTVIVGKAVDVSTLPLAALVLPVDGVIDVDIDIKAPVRGGIRDYAHATGHVVLQCRICRIGDDKAKIPVPSRFGASSDEGLIFGHVDFDRVDVVVAIADGKATVKTFDVTSNDVEIHVAGGATLASELSSMRVDLCLRFKPTEALAARDLKTHAVLTTTGGAVGNDGFINIRLTDRLSSLKKLGQVCDGSTPAGAP